MLRSVGDGIGNSWNPNTDIRKLGNWSNGKYMLFPYFLSNGQTEGREYQCKVDLWDNIKNLKLISGTTVNSLWRL